MKESDDDTPRAPRPAGRTGPDPALRRRICTFVRDGIALGRWQPGERLPDRTWFMRRFRCTPTATQAAFAQLVRDGFVWSRARAGTFVSDPPPNAPLVPRLVRRDPRRRQVAAGANPCYVLIRRKVVKGQ